MSVYCTLVDGIVFAVNITVVANVSFLDSVVWSVDCSVSLYWSLVFGVVLDVNVYVAVKFSKGTNSKLVDVAMVDVNTPLGAELADVSFSDSAEWYC